MLTTKNATVARTNTASSMGVDLFRFTLPFQSTDYGLRMAAKPAKKWLSCGASMRASGGNNWTVRRIWIGLIAVFIAVPLCFVAYEGVQTLRILTVVEAERDQWQRPAEILRALALNDGATVVDLGSGAGYFALKLSPMVGARGVVFAEDIRRESLTFLWIRRFLRDARNVQVIVGEPDNPHLPVGTVDAVLIANTYHELSPSRPILDAVFEAMKPGARLVIVDRSHRGAGGPSPAAESGRHDISLEIVQREISQRGLETISHDQRFIDRPEDIDVWWLLVARKPLQ
jgi:predicted methyltransferase